MDLPLSLIAVLLSLSVVFIGVLLALRASRDGGGRPRRKSRDPDGSMVLMAGSDTGGSRKGSTDGDGRDSGGHDGGGSDGGGDGGGGGGD